MLPAFAIQDPASRKRPVEVRPLEAGVRAKKMECGEGERWRECERASGGVGVGGFGLKAPWRPVHAHRERVRRADDG